MQGKTCIVTGANSGIGKGTCLGLARRGARVIMVCRDAERGQAALDEIRRETGSLSLSLAICDLSSQASIRHLADKLRCEETSIDVLAHSAGALFFDREESVDGIEMNLAVNYLGAFLLTNLLRDTLVASAPARVVSVSGEYHRKVSIDFDDLQGLRRFRPIKAASQATLAKLLFTLELSRRLQGTGVVANALHPGAVRTNLTRGLPWYLRSLVAVAQPFMKSPERGAQTVVYLASSPEVATTTGQYFIDCRPAVSSDESRSEEVAGRLWKASEKLVGLG